MTPAFADPGWTIEVCPGAPVTVQRVRQAARFWARRVGAGWGSIDAGPCTGDEPGTLLLLGGELPPGALGMAQVLSVDGNGPTWAVLVLREDYDPRWLVLEHELGHALGYPHVPLCDSGHVMCPLVEFIGRSTRGL